MNESENKIDFTQPPWLIQKQILALPFEEQQYWIDLWLEHPDIKASREERDRQERESRMVHPEPINKTKPDQHWQD